MKRSLVSLIALLSLALWTAASPAHAASHTSVYRGNGWTLTMTFVQASYGETFHGSLTHGNKSYMMLGDWVPAGDQGVDLLRFYGSPFGTVKGLVSVAILGNTCNPNCAASTTYSLKPISGWNLPGLTTSKAVTLKLQV